MAPVGISANFSRRSAKEILSHSDGCCCARKTSTGRTELDAVDPNCNGAAFSQELSSAEPAAADEVVIAV